MHLLSLIGYINIILSMGTIVLLDLKKDNVNKIDVIVVNFPLK